MRVSFSQIEEVQLARKQLKTFAVVGRCAMGSNAVAVGLRRVARIALPLVMRVFCGQFSHQLIPIRFCQDLRGRDILIGSIPFDLAVIRNISIWFEPVAVHSNELGHHIQFLNGPVHAQDAGI